MPNQNYENMSNQNYDNMSSKNNENMSSQEEDIIQTAKNFIEAHAESTVKNTTDYRLLMGLDSDSIINDNSKCNSLKTYIENIKGVIIDVGMDNNPGQEYEDVEDLDDDCQDANKVLEDLNEICRQDNSVGGKRRKKNRKSRKSKKSKKSRKNKKRHTKKHRRRLY